MASECLFYLSFTIILLYTSALAEPVIITESGLSITQTFPEEYSCEKSAQNGTMLTVHYTGTFEDGEKFDSSLDGNKPFNFTIGVCPVIKGWTEGLQGMCVGEKRKLIIPPDLGYGPKGKEPVIPGNATLLFDVELLAINDGPHKQDCPR